MTDALMPSHPERVRRNQPEVNQREDLMARVAAINRHYDRMFDERILELYRPRVGCSKRDIPSGGIFE